MLFRFHVAGAGLDLRPLLVPAHEKSEMSTRTHRCCVVHEVVNRKVVEVTAEGRLDLEAGHTHDAGKGAGKESSQAQ